MRRCTYCMRETDDGNICRYCGGDENKPANPRHLPPNTAIGDRYVVGRALNQTEDAIIYAALDQRTNARIRIYEYFPRKLARRDARTLEVAPVPGSEQSYSDGLEALRARMEGLGCRLYEGNGSIYAAVDKQQATALRNGASAPVPAAAPAPMPENENQPETDEDALAENAPEGEDGDYIVPEDEISEEEMEEQEYEEAQQKRRNRIIMIAIGAGCALLFDNRHMDAYARLGGRSHGHAAHASAAGDSDRNACAVAICRGQRQSAYTRSVNRLQAHRDRQPLVDGRYLDKGQQ